MGTSLGYNQQPHVEHAVNGTASTITRGMVVALLDSGPLATAQPPDTAVPDYGAGGGDDQGDTPAGTEVAMNIGPYDTAAGDVFALGIAMADIPAGKTGPVCTKGMVEAQFDGVVAAYSEVGADGGVGDEGQLKNAAVTAALGITLEATTDYTSTGTLHWCYFIGAPVSLTESGGD